MLAKASCLINSSFFPTSNVTLSDQRHFKTILRNNKSLASQRSGQNEIRLYYNGYIDDPISEA